MERDKQIKVLLVEDEIDFRTLMTFWLKSKGYLVITAADGQSAVQLTKKDNPDVVFLDLFIPGIDGIEVLKKIREFNKDLPVIVISAYVDTPRAKEIWSYGISGVFCKSKDFTESLSLLESALKTHKKLKK